MLRLWNYLLELLRARRHRLELSLQLQKIFQEMIYVLDWMDEIKVSSARSRSDQGHPCPRCDLLIVPWVCVKCSIHAW